MTPVDLALLLAVVALLAGAVGLVIGTAIVRDGYSEGWSRGYDSGCRDTEREMRRAPR